MSVKNIGENNYKLYWTTQKCFIETNAPVELLKELNKKVYNVESLYNPIWSMARRMDYELAQYKQSNPDGKNLWWVIEDPVIRHANQRRYESK